MYRMYSRTGQSPSQTSSTLLKALEITPFPCPSCGKKIFQRAHLEGHLQSVNCAVRGWQKRKQEAGWFKAKMSWRSFFDEHGIPYEVAPCLPKQGQCIYVPGYIHDVLRMSRGLVKTFTGFVWVKRPVWLIQRRLKAAELQQKGDCAKSTA